MHKLDESYKPSVPTSSLASSREGKPVQAALQYYADGLPLPQVFNVEPFRWLGKWLNVAQDLPSSAVQASEECNH